MDETFLDGNDNSLMHYGRGHLDGGHSGRYPYGSGEEPYQHAGDFLARGKELEKGNVTFVDEKGKFGPIGKTYTGQPAVAHLMGLTTKQYRTQKSLARAEDRSDRYCRAEALRESGMGLSEIARKMGLPDESSVRSLLKSSSKNNMEKAKNTADFLKSQIDSKGLIDIGPGVEKELGISREKLDQAIAILEMQGYKNLKGSIKNITDPTGMKQINLNFVGNPKSNSSDVYNYEKLNFLNEKDYNIFREKNGIETITEFKTRDDGETYIKGFQYPESMDSKRLMIRYAEDGGLAKDGTIEIRRGVEDLSLGNSTYAQVRILVDNDKYLKGMAIYSNGKDMPKGVDVIFNTNKTKDVSKMDVLKDAKENLAKDPTNPFGSSIKEEGGQYTYIDSKGKERLGLINKTREEGDWSEWKDKLPSQFLSKQTVGLAQRQLKLAIQEKEQEYNEIMSLENNTLKKELLNTFANDCDSAAVHLYAAALPRQKHQVIISVNSMKDNEVYAPNYENGEKVALVRYPHAGTFEIPILTVNNKQKDAVSLLKNNTLDCVGINSNVAARLSGADFDGDTVMVVPTHNSSGIKIVSTPALKGLEDFDPKTQYATTKVKDSDGETHYFNKFGNEVSIMQNTNTEMGIISNLITDMTIAGANENEMARAVRHSMVVIDAAKHKLDYRSSEKKNEINALKKKYQGKFDPETGERLSGGASTIISQAKSEVPISKTQGSPIVNTKYKKNGELNPNYDASRPEGTLIYKTANDNKLKYVTVKDPTTKKDTTVYAKTNDTGKLKNIYEKEDGYYYMNNKKEIKVTDEDLYYNKGGKKKYDSKLGKEVSVYAKVKDEPMTSQSRTQNITRMEATDDATSLISRYDTRMEHIYADYANTMKEMANEARKVSYFTPNSKYSSSAKVAYAKEADSLNYSIDKASKNAPKERQAQVVATSRVKALTDGNSSVAKDDLKKIKQRELTKARREVGAKREDIAITDSEWEAIQAGAISDSKLRKLFKYTDLDDIRERATPKSSKTVTDATISRIKNYKANGKTNAEIAAALGLSVSTVSKYLQ